MVLFKKVKMGQLRVFVDPVLHISLSKMEHCLLLQSLFELTWQLDALIQVV